MLGNLHTLAKPEGCDSGFPSQIEVTVSGNSTSNIKKSNKHETRASFSFPYSQKAGSAPY